MASLTANLGAPVDAAILLSKRAVYVGGLGDGANPQLLRAAFIPFGPVKSVDMVRNN